MLLVFLQILLFLKQDPEVAHKASIYLRHLSIGLPGYAINCLAKKYLQAQNKLNIPTIVILVVAPFNIVLNYVLVWGPIPAVRIGFAGSPLATGISYNLEVRLSYLSPSLSSCQGPGVLTRALPDPFVCCTKSGIALRRLRGVFKGQASLGGHLLQASV